MSDHLKNWEAEIRADERERIKKELVAIGNILMQADNRLSALVDPPAKAPKSPAVARKTRKAVSAMEDEIQTVLMALTELQRQYVDRYFSIKELCGAVGIGAKTVGAALRALEEGGVLVEKGRKYCLAAVEQTSNGAGLWR